MSTNLTGTIRPPRYGAAVIDQLLVFFGLVALGGSISDWIPSNSELLRMAIGISLFGGYFVYYFVFEWLIGATPGKLFTGLRIRKLDGSRCDAKAAFLRTITRFIEFNPIFLGGLPAAIIAYRSELRQRWGDKLAGTVVVKHKGW